MRTPTPEAVALAWWYEAVAAGGREIARHDGDPQAGWFKGRMVKGGPWVPVRLWLHQSIDPDTGELDEPEKLMGEQNGRSINPALVWTYLRPISLEEYEALTERHRTLPVMAATHAAIDLTATPIGPGE